jgi:ribosomal protein S18 acetylase RimI-like enzyme
MISLKRITPADVTLFRIVRLRALQDTPSAFSATYAEECRLADTDWISRIAQWSGSASTTYIAMEADAACGIAGGYLEQSDRSRAHLVSMWVAPSHRRLGIGAKLVDAIIDWARGQNARTLELIVTSNNDVAINFYTRLGFTFTGKTSPYRNDPALTDQEMIRTISG